MAGGVCGGVGSIGKWTGGEGRGVGNHHRGH